MARWRGSEETSEERDSDDGHDVYGWLQSCLDAGPGLKPRRAALFDKA